MMRILLVVPTAALGALVGIAFAADAGWPLWTSLLWAGGFAALYLWDRVQRAD